MENQKKKNPPKKEFKKKKQIELVEWLKWPRPCLARVRPSLQPQTPPKKKKKVKKVSNLEIPKRRKWTKGRGEKL
jgi:hypothetical protein